jgi:hypothetical protein
MWKPAVAYSYQFQSAAANLNNVVLSGADGMGAE